jgi:hypothetical protein
MTSHQVRHAPGDTPTMLQEEAMIPMNPLAAELNDSLAQHSPHVLEMLSDLGKNLFFPKGILTQSAEAKEKAHKFNATIGIATENGGPMFLSCIQDKLSSFDPKDIYPYAPPAGNPNSAPCGARRCCEKTRASRDATSATRSSPMP